MTIIKIAKKNTIKIKGTNKNEYLVPNNEIVTNRNFHNYHSYVNLWSL